MFKKPSTSRSIRKRPAAEEDNDNEGRESVVVQKNKSSRKADGKLAFSTEAGSRRDKNKELEGTEETAPASYTFAFESDRQVQTANDSNATATLEIDTEKDRDARAIREKVLKQAQQAIDGGTSTDSKVYKGIAGYTDHKAGFRREHTVGGDKALGTHGPLRASAHIRMSVRFDYQPDLCKDYKETGYCGYGDACKFLHDRGDYKSGWQMEKEWDEKEKKRRDKVAAGRGGEDVEGGDSVDEGSEEDEDALPFACFICREPFTDPVVTRCHHYFCEHCALKVCAILSLQFVSSIYGQQTKGFLLPMLMMLPLKSFYPDMNICKSCINYEVEGVIAPPLFQPLLLV